MPETDKVAIEITQGDITKQLDMAAIVNAANTRLVGGGGVDGAIHRAAGKVALQALCKEIPEIKPGSGIRCPTGEARITDGCALPMRIIHTAGPVYRESAAYEAELLLRACYRNCLFLAAEHKLRSIVFPSISTGAYGYPFEEATSIAINEIQSVLEKHSVFECVRLIFFSQSEYEQAMMLLRNTAAS